jgi:hypothetical protein
MAFSLIAIVRWCIGRFELVRLRAHVSLGVVGSFIFSVDDCPEYPFLYFLKKDFSKVSPQLGKGMSIS